MVKFVICAQIIVVTFSVAALPAQSSMPAGVVSPGVSLRSVSPSAAATNSSMTSVLDHGRTQRHSSAKMVSVTAKIHSGGKAEEAKLRANGWYEIHSGNVERHDLQQ